jgi:adenylate cyclase
MGFRVLTEGVRNRWLEGTFGKYLSPSVIEALKKDPGLIELGGRRVEVSVLFSDIQGFTGISERLKPEDLVRLLNRYLTRQSAEVLAEEGVIDKFIGDAVMAFFGDPIPHPDHAVRACRAAVHCVAALPDLEPLTRELGLPPLLNRIGVNSGPAFVGNMGSDARFDYTAMGDTVNLASRLESANKVFGSRILIGPATFEQAKASIHAKPLARLQVVGKTKPMQVYELVGIRGEALPAVVEHAEAYGRAHAALLADDLEGAARELAEAERAKPRDIPTSWLRGILAQVSDGTLPRPWDGILVLESK